MNHSGQSPDWLAAAVNAATEDIDTLLRVASDRALTEDLALTLLRSRDLPSQVVEAVGKNVAVSRLRQVRWALITHQRTPRHTSLPLLRHLYPFELMKLALVPQLATDLKRAAEEALITKSASLSSGERLTLAKQGSSRLVAALLLDPEPRVTDAALNNPRLTEEAVVRAFLHAKVTSHLAHAICHHKVWRLRPEVRIAALRCEFTPLASAIDFASRIALPQLKEILSQGNLSDQVKQYLLQAAESRSLNTAQQNN